MLMHNQSQPTQTPARYLKQLPDGRRVLQLPGQTRPWNWGKVTAALERLAELLICLSGPMLVRLQMSVPWVEWTIRGPIRSFGRGFLTMRPVPSIWRVCAGQKAFGARCVVAIGRGGPRRSIGSAPTAGARPR